MNFLTFGMHKVWGLQCMRSGSSGSSHDYLSFTYTNGLFAVQGLEGYSVISGGRVTWERVNQWIVFVLGQRGDERQVSKEHSCFSSTLDGYGIG